MYLVAFAPHSAICMRQNTRSNIQITGPCCSLLIARTTCAAAAYLMLSTSIHAEQPRVVEGLLRSCAPTTLTCVSTQDDAPASFMEPWSYDDDIDKVRARVYAAINNEGGVIDTIEGRYVRAVFDKDEVEFYFTENDNIIQVRADGITHPKFDFGRNRNRVNRMRLNAGLETVPVLRGRQRKLRVFETPFDDFAPSLPNTDAFIDRVREGAKILDQPTAS